MNLKCEEKVELLFSISVNKIGNTICNGLECVECTSSISLCVCVWKISANKWAVKVDGSIHCFNIIMKMRFKLWNQSRKWINWRIQWKINLFISMTGTRHIWMASNASGGQIDADATIDDYECGSTFRSHWTKINEQKLAGSIEHVIIIIISL